MPPSARTPRRPTPSRRRLASRSGGASSTPWSPPSSGARNARSPPICAVTAACSTTRPSARSWSASQAGGALSDGFPRRAAAGKAVRRLPSSATIDSALVAVVADRADVNVPDAGVAEGGLGGLSQRLWRNNPARAVDDAVIGTVAAYQKAFPPQEHRGHAGALGVARAGLCVQEDGTLLGIGLGRGERAVRQDQIGLARRDAVETVTARHHAAWADVPLGAVAVGVGRPV